jgi:hypothetical protein
MTANINFPVFHISSISKSGIMPSLKQQRKIYPMLDNNSIARILEFAMLFCFGFSWPFAIAKTVKAKKVDGKSPLFEAIVIVGYLFGIAAHLISDRSWVIWVYIVDILLVSTDLTLYFHYYRLNKNKNS